MSDGKSYCIDAALADLEQRLDPRSFVRIHRAALVNADWVAELQYEAGGGVMIEPRDRQKTRLAVARSRVSEVKARLGS